MEVKDVKPNSSFDRLELEITEMGEPREFTNFRGKGRVLNAKGKDDSGEINIVFWGDEIDKVEGLGEGDSLVIEKGWAKTYQGEVQVGTGKYGKLILEE